MCEVIIIYDKTWIPVAVICLEGEGREGLESGSLQIVCGHAVESHHSHTVVLQNQVVAEEVGLVTRSLTHGTEGVSM